jgi:thiosulfate/3-mercaptopyruvate sulfurtransferase
MRTALHLGLWAFALGCTPDGTGSEDPTNDPTGATTPWRAVSVTEADEALADGAQLLDSRGADDFAASHLESALSVDGAALRGTVDGVSGQVLSRADAVALFEAGGVEAGSPIVVYGRDNDTTTARTLWTLAYFGAGDDLLLVDGGLDAWVAAGAGLSPGAPEAAPSTWGGEATREDLRVDKDWVLDHLDDDTVTLFDVRTAAEYADGHIPGAIHVDWTDNLDGDGLFRGNVLGRHGDPDGTVVVYCASGARASVSWALLVDAGLEDVRLYDGSWNEWSADDSTPKTEGDQP